MSEPEIVLYHNPACSTSRAVLAAIREAGREPQIVDYLAVGWTEPQLRALLAQMKLRPRDILRVRGTPAEALGLTDPSVSDDEIVRAMTREPSLVERPIVVTGKGTILARPTEKVAQVL